MIHSGDGGAFYCASRGDLVPGEGNNVAYWLAVPTCWAATSAWF
jgi:hypothetical protein